jgi:mono/diheme cytochrome c family protein
MAPALALALAAALACCGGSEGAGAMGPPSPTPDGGAVDAASPNGASFIPPSPQRSGDPQKGYDALVNNGYVGCGIPWTAYSTVFQPAPANQQIPGRNAQNATIPYSLTRFTTAEGVDVVGPNCLTCHAAPLLGNVVIGLGDTATDYTTDHSQMAAWAQILVSQPAEVAEVQKFADRYQAIGPYTVTATIGVNPADDVAAVLFSHRDQTTLAWSDTPILALPPKIVVPVDVPPWWRMSKKNAMFYTAAGRGDHARIMMTSSTLCIDAVSQAQAIDAYFVDVAAYVKSLTPPKWPFAVDAAKASRGQQLFAGACAMCHGTYSASPTYPNLVIAVGDVGTDSALASGAAQFSGAYEDWFNGSFYGQVAHLDTQKAYYAPPLDGIWATAPYLHNGSVPNLAALMDSTKRPAAFTRTYDSNDYDQANVGWNFTAATTGQTGNNVYDTTKTGYGNGGHTYGDLMSPDDRAAVIEYLKTL